MMKKHFSWIALIVLVSFLAIFSLASGEDRKTAVTQEELAKTLADRMDLDVAKEAPANDYFKALEERGVKPAEGWDQKKPVTKQDLGDVLIGAGRLRPEVLSGKDQGAVLKERGIIIPNEINKKTMEDVFKDQNVNRLLETPAPSGPSVPFPQEEVKVVGPTPTPFPVPEITMPPVIMAPIEEKPGAPIVPPTPPEPPPKPPEPPPPPPPPEPPPPPPPPEPPKPPVPSGGGSE